VKELKSTLSGSEFQQLITRSMKKNCTQLIRATFTSALSSLATLSPKRCNEGQWLKTSPDHGAIKLFMSILIFFENVK